MLSHAPTPEPELTHNNDLIPHELFDADTDDASSGYIVFSLGPDFEEATLDAYGDLAPAQRTA